MKKILTSIIALLFMALNASSMSYEQARREAFFLTDKMAYELNLTHEQYDAAYEINLDYLMGVSTVDDVFSEYWRRRNLDMSYILLQWQWEAFRAATYFYRPLYWADGFGTLLFTHAIQDETISISAVQRFMLPIEADTVGAAMEDVVTIMPTETISASRHHMVVCATDGTKANSAATEQAERVQHV